MNVRLIYLLLCLFIFNFSNCFHAQKTILKDSLKTIKEILIEGRNKDIDRLPTLEGVRINAGKKNEVIQLSALNADLSTNNARQVFGKVPGISIWESDGSGIQVGVATRGLSPNRSWEFNVRQNGYDISSEAFGYPEAYYTPPMEALEKIEVLRGAASLQYGSQFGGLLNYITKSKIGEKPFSFETQQTFGSYGFYNAFNAIGGKIKKFSYYAYMHHRTADGWRENSSYKTNTGFVNLTYQFTEKLKVNVEYTNMNYLSQQPGGLTDSMFQLNPQHSVRSRNWFSTPWNSVAVNLDYSMNKNNRINVKLFKTIAQRNSVGFMKDIFIEDTFNINLGSYNYRQLDRDFYNNTGVEIRYLKEYQLNSQKNALSIGLRAYDGRTQRKQVGIGSGESDYDLSIVQLYSTSSGSLEYKKDLSLRTQNAAFFVENLFTLNKRLSIVPGFRFEYINTGVKGYIDKPNIGDRIQQPNQIRNVLLGGIGIEYKTSEETNIYSNFSQAFRPVTYSELLPSATTDSIDSDLMDAKGYNLDLGYRGSIKNLVNFDIGVFYLNYDNRIGTIVVNGKNLKTNIGTSVSRGLESFVEFDLFKIVQIDRLCGNLKLYANVSLIDAKYSKWDDPASAIDSTKDFRGNYVENAPRNINRFGLSYKYNRFSVTFQFNSVSGVYTDAANTENPNSKSTIGRIDGYQVMDLSATYLINGKYNVKAGVNNLTNEIYATRRSGGYPGPGILPANGRTFYFSIGAKF
jgi:Fe(3+) dicitrate transport protein